MRSAGALALHLLCVAGCATSRPGATRVAEVKLVGNHAVSADAIIGGLATRNASGILFKEYAEYDEVSVARDRERIAAYYQTQGYFSAEVTGVDVRRLAGDEVAVTFTVKEGRPAHVDSVAVGGMPADLAGDRRLAELVLVKKGDVYTQLAYDGTKDNLLGFLVRHGYAHAEVKGAVKVDRDHETAAMQFLVDPGPLVQFGPTQVNGLERVPESAVRNRLAWEEGERYDPRKVEVTRGRLYQLGYLSSVRIDVVGEGRPETAPIDLRAREGERHELKIGAGAALDNDNVQVRPRLGYTIKGFLDPLLTVGFDARPGLIVAGQGNAGSLAGEIGVTLERDDFLVPRVKATAEVVGEVVDLETYDSLGLRGRVGLSRPLFSDRVVVGAAYQLRLLHFSSISPSLTAAARQLVGVPADVDTSELTLDYRVASFQQSVALDLRDNPLDTRNGLYVEVRAEEAGGFSGSRFDYVKLTPELRAFYSPLWFFGFAGKVRYGVADTDAVPITERYFSGGASSHRGFSFRRLSPTASGADGTLTPIPIGGNTLFETSVEARLDIVKLAGNWLGVVAFLDGGDVTLTHAELDLANLHWAVGGGLRYHTVIGPIRFDLGYRLNRYGPGEPDPGNRWAWHLSLGQAF